MVYILDYSQHSLDVLELVYIQLLYIPKCSNHSGGTVVAQVGLPSCLYIQGRARSLRHRGSARPGSSKPGYLNCRPSLFTTTEYKTDPSNKAQL